MSGFALWGVFAVVVVGLLALDLAVFHRRAHRVTLGEALAWSSVWIGLAMLFNLGIYAFRGPGTALEFLTGYLLEKVLSIDMLFVFLLIFGYFRVPPSYQHKVLFWGIVGALVMRVGLIAGGLSLIQRFHWLVYVFGAFLLATGVRLALQSEKRLRPERNALVRLARRLLPLTESYAGGRFFATENGRRSATPLFLAMLVIETTDLVFAVDSIPAVMAVTLDPFVVYTSNAFALLGLRSLYFAVAGIVPVFHQLHYGFAAILSFAGLKMLLTDIQPIPVEATLGVIGGILLVSMLASVARPRREQIQALMDQGIQAGTFVPAEEELVENVLWLREAPVTSLMLPRREIVWLDPQTPPAELRRVLQEHGFSRFPVAQGSIDGVLGIVHVRDLLVQGLEGTLQLREVMQQPLYLPEHTPALSLLERFRQQRTQIALVVDEQGLITGLVTLHDVVEAIAGELPAREQTGTGKPYAIREGPRTWRVDGALPLAELPDVPGLELPQLATEEAARYGTVAGLVLWHLGRIPAPGERFELDGVRFEVARMDGRRIDEVLIEIGSSHDAPDAQPDA